MIDKSETFEPLSRICLFAKKYRKVSGKKYKRTNIVAAKCGSEIVAPMIYDGTTDNLLFERWFKMSSFYPVTS